MEVLSLDDSFTFSCTPDVECFNRCCRNINLFLTPYDIVRMKRRLGTSSAEFLRTYAVPLFPEASGHPVVLLKMLPDDTKSCPFSSADGCLIYDDRPWSCRSFPLAPSEGAEDRQAEVVRLDFCRGFEKGRPRTVRAWRDEQKMDMYDEMNAEWKKVTHHDKFQSRNLLEGAGRDIFFLGSYNIDGFRDLVFKGDFQKYFVIDKAELKKLGAQETELLKFAFTWLRQVLFGEQLLKRR
jgi:Fe-S-cluster containining protein